MIDIQRSGSIKVVYVDYIHFLFNNINLLIYIIILSFTWEPVYGNLSIAPQIIETEARSGIPNFFSINVSNGSDSLLNCTVSISPMTLTGAGLPTPSDDAPRSCSTWITPDIGSFTLQSKGSQTVKLKAVIPPEASGGYYCIVIVDAKPSSNTDEKQQGPGVNSSINFSFRSSAVVLMIVPRGRLSSSLKPTDLTFKMNSKSGTYDMLLPVRNEGNVHARISGIVQIKSEEGQVVEEVPLAAGRGFLLPEQERIFTNKGEVNFPDGVYVAKIQLEEAHSKRRAQRDYPFFIKGGVPSIAPLNDEIHQLLLKQSLGFALNTNQMVLEAKPGARKTQPVQLINMTKEKIPIRAILSKWVRNASGEDLVTIMDSSPAESLLSLRQTEFELPPLGKRQIPLIVSFPKDITGEAFSAVTFNRTDRPLGNTPYEYARRSVMVRMIPTGTLVAGGAVTMFSVLRRPDGIINLDISVKNTGNSSWEPEILVDITGKNGQNIGRIYGTPEQMFRILPEGTATFSLSWDQILQPGTYTAQVMLRFDPNKPAVTKDVRFEVPPLQGTSSASAVTPAAVGAETDTLPAPLPQSATQAVTR